jgi:hypothetical protein
MDLHRSKNMEHDKWYTYIEVEIDMHVCMDGMEWNGMECYVV